MKSMYVTDRKAVGHDRFVHILEKLRGAPGLSVEIRERGSSDRETLEWARMARAALGFDVPLSVNRRFDLALAAGADGVQLPADGLPPARVRTATPRGFRIGISTHSAAEAAAAIEEAVEVVVLGPIFETPSKVEFGAPLGLAVLGELPVLASHSTEVYAIGGISEERLEELLPFRDRISGIAAIRLFQLAPDPRAVVERIATR